MVIQNERNRVWNMMRYINFFVIALLGRVIIRKAASSILFTPLLTYFHRRMELEPHGIILESDFVWNVRSPLIVVWARVHNDRFGHFSSNKSHLDSSFRFTYQNRSTDFIVLAPRSLSHNEDCSRTTFMASWKDPSLNRTRKSYTGENEDIMYPFLVVDFETGAPSLARLSISNGLNCQEMHVNLIRFVRISISFDPFSRPEFPDSQTRCWAL